MYSWALLYIIVTVTVCMVKAVGQNGSDHAVVASYSELYEEGEVEHINSVWPVSSSNSEN